MLLHLLIPILYDLSHFKCGYQVYLKKMFSFAIKCTNKNSIWRQIVASDCLAWTTQRRKFCEIANAKFHKLASIWYDAVIIHSRTRFLLLLISSCMHEWMYYNKEILLFAVIQLFFSQCMKLRIIFHIDWI